MYFGFVEIECHNSSVSSLILVLAVSACFCYINVQGMFKKYGNKGSDAENIVLLLGADGTLTFKHLSYHGIPAKKKSVSRC